MTEVAPPKPKKSKGPRSKYWCCTINNPTAADIQSISTLVERKLATYVIVGKEHFGPRPNELPEEFSWTPHLQCYCQFPTRKEVTACQKLVKGAWFVTKGSSEDNYQYCTKGDILTIKQYPTLPPMYDNLVVNQPDYAVYGNSCDVTRRDSIKETDEEKVDKLQVIIDQEETIEGLMRSHASIYCRNRNGLSDIYALKLKDSGLKKRVPFIIWAAGPTGCGKSRLAHEIAAWFKTDPWISGDNLKWFDQLTPATECVIFDDFRRQMCDFPWLLRLMDRYPLNCQIKGVRGGTFFNPVVIVITCPRVPQEEFVYRDKYESGITKEYEDVMQVVRRCHVIMKWNSMFQTWEFLNCGENDDTCKLRYQNFCQQYNPELQHLQTQAMQARTFIIESQPPPIFGPLANE